MSAPVVRTMTRGDLERVLGWAEAEGWNPGRADVPAFLAADPGGFLVAEVAGVPVASLSIVRFEDATAFLGLYICVPEHRGRGLGSALWRAGESRLMARATGLDAVPDRQATYARSGFVPSHGTCRFTGTLAAAGPDRTVPLRPEDLDAAIELDRSVTGFGRAGFMRPWLLGDAGRMARILIRDGRLAGLGVVRECAVGSKIGPLLAEDRAAAEAILDGLAGAASGAPVSLDVPAANPAAIALAVARRLTPGFETVRMWRGPPPPQDTGRTFGIATLELG